MLFSMNDFVATGRKACWPSERWERSHLGVRQSGRERSHVEAVGGDINDTRMERMQPKCAGFSLMDCLPSLLPWGQ